MKKAWAVSGLAILAMAAITGSRGEVFGSLVGTVMDALPVMQSEHNSTAGIKSDHSSDVRTIEFSGYEWKVKSSSGRVGPGPNYFSDSKDNIEVDAQGRLHLRITQRDGRWYCAEVISARSFGYGTYRFSVDTNFDSMDPRVVLGLFTWSDAPAYSHREIDVEISQWGNKDNKNGQFVVQPYTRPANVVRFQIPPGLNASTHSFVWKPDSVFCQSLKGIQANQSGANFIIQEHTFRRGIPQAGGENARINLWLMVGHPPTNRKEIEIIISKFEFVKLLQ